LQVTAVPTGIFASANISSRKTLPIQVKIADVLSTTCRRLRGPPVKSPAQLFAPRRARAFLLACLAIGAGLVVGACSLQTRMPQLPQTTPAGWQDRQASAGGLAPDLDTWWRAFGDATLDRMIERALQDNLNIQIAGERLKAARALRHKSRSDYWPNLNFRIYEETSPGATTGFFEMGFDSTWEFGLFGRSQATSNMALADENGALVDEAAARVSVVAEVAKNYVELRAAQMRLQILDEFVALRRRQLDLNQARLRTHMASELEVDRARSELQQALSDASEPKLVLVQTTQAIAVLLGTNTPDVALTTAASQPNLPAIDIRQAPADLLRTRPEIRRAEQNILRAAGELGIARADLYPKLGINGILVSSTPVTQHLGDIDAVPVIGPTFTLPILDWGARRDVINARESALAASVLAYREAVLESVAEAQTAIAQFDAKSELMDTAQRSLDLNQRAVKSAQTLQRIGLGDGLDSAAANLALSQSRLQQNGVLRDRALSYIALYKAFGGTIPPLKMPQDKASNQGSDAAAPNP
jgi:NodT family efflux transporter outer membrane factor (OMF) lipoprotein